MGIEFTDILAAIENVIENSWVDNSALVIVAAAYMLLWLLGKLFSYRSFGAAYQVPTERKEYSTDLLRGLHVTGLSHPLINEFNVLANKKDTLKLAMYLAMYQPSIHEVNEFVQSAEELTSDSNIGTVNVEEFWELAHFESNSNRLRILNQDDLRSLCRHHKKNHKFIKKVKKQIASLGNYR